MINSMHAENFTASPSLLLCFDYGEEMLYSACLHVIFYNRYTGIQANIVDGFCARSMCSNTHLQAVLY